MSGNSNHPLLSAAAVRTCAHEMLALGVEGKLAPWRVNLDDLDDAAELTAEVTRARYPDLNVPFHARWRHFELGERDLWAEISGRAGGDPRAVARSAFDLATVSVLLDAGAGPAWRYADEATGAVLDRSEGLALASLRLFERGGFSADPEAPLRADASALRGLAASDLATGFQAGAENPLTGLEGRAALLARLGEAMEARPDLFALEDRPRPGGLFDVLAARAEGGKLPAAEILALLLEALGPIWQGRPELDGVSLGDCWPHPALPAPGFAPLHKLSQWLAYSLVEPLEAAGVRVVELDGLTGLAEYRNGGLFIDLGVLQLDNDPATDKIWAVDDPAIVAWRSMTVALLDEIAPEVREILGVGQDRFPLARVLEGGTWAAGREIARRLRPDGAPPLKVASDGTVF
jgi:hypothetical protein